MGENRSIGYDLSAKPPAHPSSRSNFELRAHILQVVSRCLDEIPLEKLTISLICSRAKISRPTFYRYFTDRYDVFNWLLRTTMKSSLAQIGIAFSWEDAIMRFCRAMEANRDLASKYLADHTQFSPFDRFIGYLQDTLRQSAALRFDSAEAIPLRIRFQSIAFSRSFVAAFADWLDGELIHSISIDEFVACAISIVPEDLFCLLDTDPEGRSFSDEWLQAQDRSPLIEFVAEEFPTNL